MSFRERLSNLSDMPLRGLRSSLWWVRKTFFVKPRSDCPSLVANCSEEKANRYLGRNYFEPGWELSYYYRGEALNLRRVEYIPDHPMEYSWWQVHIRGYPHPDGFELTAHFETDPSEHPNAHIEQVGLEEERGMEELRSILDAEGVEYESLEEPAVAPTQ